MDAESRIVYESGPFYAFKMSKGIEIRKNKKGGYSTVIGTAATEAQAIRFIDRANLHPDKF